MGGSKAKARLTKRRLQPFPPDPHTNFFSIDSREPLKGSGDNKSKKIELCPHSWYLLETKKGVVKVASGEKKRHRQSQLRRDRNQAGKSKVKTLMKNVESAVENGDRETIKSALRTAISALHKAGQKRLIPRNAADRHVGQISRLAHQHGLKTAE